MSNWNTQLKGLISFYKKHAKKKLQEHRNFLDDFRKEFKLKGGYSFELIDRLKELSFELMDKEDLDKDNFEKLRVIEKVIPSFAIIELSQSLELKKINDEKSLYTAFCLGYYCGTSEKHEQELTPVNLYADYYHRLKSKMAANKKWERRNKKLADALETADKLWTEGDDLLHHEMAKYLSEMYEELSYTELKKNLKPIAIKHNRLFGIKGVTKIPTNS